MSDNNIVSFTSIPDTLSASEIYDELNRAKQEKAEYIIDETLSYFYGILEQFNYRDPDNSEDFLNSIMIIESIRSFLWAKIKMHHVLQDITKDIFYVDETGNVQMVPETDEETKLINNNEV